jgi:transposase-like protein
MHKEVKSKSPLQNLMDNFSNEENSRALLERIRWPDGVRCPRDDCGSDQVMRFKSRPIFKCKKCGRQFSVTVGTIFEDSHIPLRTWLHVIYLMCASKKGMSAHQIHRQFGLSYKSAWFMCHRIRYAMSEKTLEPLAGTIEVDETYVGGKPRKGAPIKHQRGVRHYRTFNVQDKAPVFGILERGGRVRAMPVDKVHRDVLYPIMIANIDRGKSRLITDDNRVYKGIKRYLPHESVNHQETYVTGGDIHIQGIENFWSLLKRGLIGTYHHVRAHYLGQYVDEFAFRYNARKMTDPERFAHALRNVDGRLTWFVGRGS